MKRFLLQGMANTRLLPLTGVVLCFALPATAAEQLTPISVGASAINAAEVDPEDSITQVRVIEREAFAGRITTLADTLRESGHAQIRQTGGLGSASTLSIRGSTSQQVSIILDGMLLNDPVSGHADISRVSLHDIGRIQLYPGGAPARYAHAGIGGLVVMDTLDTGNAPGTDITLGAGSFGTQRYAMTTRVYHGRWHHWLSLNHQASDNDFRYRNQPPWFNPNYGRHTHRRNAQVEQFDASLKSGFQIDTQRQVDALLQWQDSEQGVPTIQNWARNRTALDTDGRRLQLSYRDSSWLNGQVHSSHRLLWANTHQHYSNRDGYVGTGNQDTRTHMQQLGMAHTASWLTGNHILSATLDLSHYDYRQRDVMRTEGRDERRRWQFNSAASHEWRSEDGYWATQAVVRGFITDDDSEEIDPTGRPFRNRERDHYTGWQLALTRHFGEHWRLLGSISQQVRIPTLREKYGQEGLFVGNPELQAEQALNIDLTLRTEQRWGHFEMTGYYRDLDPAVVAIYDSRGIGRYSNLAARIHGLESTLHLTPASFWHLTFSGALQDSENRSNAALFSHEMKLPGIYHRTFMARSSWLIDPFQFALTWREDGELYYDAANYLKADTRNQIDALVSWEGRLIRQHRSKISLELRNLADEQHQDFTRFPGPGRSWWLTFTHHIE